MNEQRVDEQFLILHGKAGNWPGDVSIQCAEAIYRTGKTFSVNSVFVDIDPGPGRSLIFLAAAARAVGGKVFTTGDFSQQDMFWYNRTVKMFSYRDIVEHRRDQSTVESRDFIVARANEDLSGLHDSLNPKGAMLIVGGTQDFGNGKPVETGPGYAVWKKT